MSQNIEVKGHDYYASLINLRLELEKQNYYLLGNAARRDISCGGMPRKSSDGCLAYVCRLGEFVYLDDYVNIFDYADPNLIVSVSQQEEFNRLYRSSLPDYPSQTNH